MIHVRGVSVFPCVSALPPPLRQGCGFSELDAGVVRLLRGWLEETGWRLLSALPRRTRGSSALILALARLLRAEGKAGVGEALCLEAVAARRAALGDRHPETVAALTVLAGAVGDQGPARGKEAEGLFREALAACKGGSSVRAPPANGGAGGGGAGGGGTAAAAGEQFKLLSAAAAEGLAALLRGQPGREAEAEALFPRGGAQGEPAAALLLVAAVDR